MATHRNNPEGKAQAEFFKEIRFAYRNRKDFFDLLLFSTLNGAYLGGNSKEKRSILFMKYKRQGAVNGVSDILYLAPRGRFAYLAIELKDEARRGEADGGASKDQIAWIEQARAAGGFPMICYGADEAITAFNAYMEMPVRR